MLFASCRLSMAVRPIIVLGFDPLRISRKTAMKAERLEWPDGRAACDGRTWGTRLGFTYLDQI